MSVGLTFLLCLLSKAHRGEGLGIPSNLLGCHSWQSCSVSACCLRRTLWLLGLVASVLCALLARQWILNMCQSSVAFGCYSSFLCESGPWILRSIHIQTFGVSTSPLVFGSHWFGVLPWEVYRKLWIYWEMTSGLFRFTGCFVHSSRIVLSFCRGVTIMRIFLESISVFFRIQRVLA